MPTFEVTLSDGKTYEIESNREPTPDEAADLVKTEFKLDIAKGPAVGQGMGAGMGNSLAQGFTKGLNATFFTGPGAVLEAVGLEDNMLQETGKQIDTDIEAGFPISEENQGKFIVKAAGAVGQAGSMIAVYPFSGASTGFKAASMAGKARQIALLGGFQGAAAGEQEATRLGINDPLTKSLVIAGYGSAEFISEHIGGYGVESSLTKLLGGEVAEAGARQVIKQGVVEGLEEIGAGVPQRAISRLATTEDPTKPGFTFDGQAIPAPWDVGQITEEFALGAIAGSGITLATDVLNKMTPAQQRDSKAVAGMPRPIRQSTYEQLQEVNAEEAKVLAVAGNVDAATASNVRLAMDGRRANILAEAAKTTTAEYAEGWEERQRATLVQKTDAGLTIQINGQWFQETWKNENGTSILEPLTQTTKLDQEREEWIQTGEPPEGWAQPETPAPLAGQPAAEVSAPPTVQAAPAMGSELQTIKGPAIEGEPVVFVTDVPLKGLPDETLLPAQDGGMYRIWTPAPGRKAVEEIPPTPQPPKPAQPSIAERFPEPVRSEDSQAARTLTVQQKGRALAMWSERKTTADIAEALNIPVGVAVEAKAQLGVPEETVPGEGGMVENPAFTAWRNKMNAKVRTRTLAPHPAGATDILDWLTENPIYVPPKGERGGEVDFLAKDDRISAHYRQFITTRDSASKTADVIATRAVERGLLPEGSTSNELGEAIEAAIKARKSIRAQIKREGAMEKRAEDQTKRFYQDTAEGPVRVDPYELVKGDVLIVENTPLQVTKIEEDDDGHVLQVTLQDGKRYGIQQISGDYVFLVDEFRPSPKRPAGEMATGTFLPAGEEPQDAFALEETSAEELVAEAEADRQRREIAARQAAPLRGGMRAEDTTPDMLDNTAGGLFAQPQAKAPVEAPPVIPQPTPQVEEQAETLDPYLVDLGRSPTKTVGIITSELGEYTEEERTALQRILKTPDNKPRTLATALKQFEPKTGSRGPSNYQTERRNEATRRDAVDEQLDRDEGIVRARRRSMRVRDVVYTGVTQLNAEQAKAALAGLLPTAQEAWIGKAADVRNAPGLRRAFVQSARLRDPSLTLEEAEEKFLQFADSLPGSKMEGFTVGGRPYVLIDEVGVTEEDKTPARAVRRVLIHEDAHEAVESAIDSDPALKAEWESIKNDIAPEELDSLAQDRYPWLADWRNNEQMHDDIAHEWIAEQAEILQKGGEPATGILARIMEFFRKIIGKYFGEQAQSVSEQRVMDFIEAGRAARSREVRLANPLRPSTQNVFAPMDTAQPPMPNELVGWELKNGDTIEWNGPGKPPSEVASVQDAGGNAKLVTFKDGTQAAVDASQGFVRFSAQPTYSTWSAERKRQYDEFHADTRIPESMKRFTEFLGSPTHTRRIRQALAPMVEMARAKLGGYWGGEVEVSAENTERVQELAAIAFTPDDSFAKAYSKEFQDHWSPRVNGKPIHLGSVAAGVLQMEILDYATKLAATGDHSLVQQLMPYANDVIIGDYFTMSNAGRALNVRSQAGRDTGFWTGIKMLQKGQMEAAMEHLGGTEAELEELRASIWSDEVQTDVEDAMAGEATTAEGTKHLQPGTPSEDYLMEGYMERGIQVLSEEERAAFIQFDKTMQRIDQLQQLKEAMQAKAANVVRPSMQEDIQAFNSPEQIQAEIDKLTVEAKELLTKFAKTSQSSLSKEKRKKVLDRSPKAKKVLSADAQAKKMMDNLENKPQRKKGEPPAWKQTYTDQIKNPQTEEEFAAEMTKHGVEASTADKLYEQAKKSSRDRQDKRDAKTRERKAAHAAATPEAFSAWVGGETQEGIADFDALIAAHVTPTGFNVDAFKAALTNKFSSVDPGLIEDAAERVQEKIAEKEDAEAPAPIDFDARAKNIVARAIAKASDATKALKDPMTEAIKSRMKGDITSKQLENTLQALGVETETAFAVVRKVEEDIAARAAKRAAAALKSEAQRPTKTADQIIDDLATSQSDTLAWKKAAQTDPVRALVRENIKKPAADFVSKAVALGVPQAQAKTLESLTTEENRRVESLKTANEAARKAAEPTKTAEALIDTLDKQQTEWVPVENKSAVRELAKKARRDSARGVRRDWFNTYQQQFEALGVKPDVAQVLVSRLWAENQKDRVNAMIRRRESATSSEAFLNSIVREIFGATLQQQADPAWRRQTAIKAFRDRGLTEIEAKAAAAWFEHRFDKHLAEAQVKGMQKAGRALDVEKPTLAKIIAAVRTRMLDPMTTDPVVRALSEAAGFKPLTTAQFTRLAQLDQQMQTEGPHLRAKAAAEMLDIMLAAKPPKKWADIITQAWISSALASTSTMSMSAIHAVFIPARKITFDFAGVLIDVLAKKTKPADAAGLYVNMLGNMISAFDNFANTARFSFKNDAYTQRIVEFIHQMHSLHAEFQDAQAELRNPNTSAAGKVKAFVKLSYASTDYVRRILSTADETWGGVIQDYVLRSESMRVLVQKGGLTPQKAAILLNAANNEGEIVLQRHMKETGDGVESALVARDAVQAAIAQTVAKYTDLETAEDVKKTAELEAPFELGNRGPETAPLWDIVNFGMEGFKRIAWAVRSENQLLGRMLTGFVTVPANILNRSAYFTPLGIARALYKMGKLGGSKQTIADMYEETMATDGQQRMRLIEGIAGTIGFMLLIAMTSHDDDDDGLNITGAGPKNSSVSDAWKKMGHKPNHIEWVRKNGTVAFSVPWARGGLDHMSLPFTLMGTLDDMKLQGLREQPKNVEWATQFAKTGLMGLANQARFFGMKSLVSMPSQTSTNSLASNAAYYAAPFFPWSGFLKSVGRTMTGQTDQTSAWSAAMAQLPFTSAFATQPALNALGDPKGLHPVDIATLSSDRAEMAGLPMFIGIDPKSKDSDLYQFMIKEGVAPNIPARSTLESKNGFLPDATWQTYVKTRGAMIKAELHRQLPRLKLMEEAELQNTIERISGDATMKTKKQMKLK